MNGKHILREAFPHLFALTPNPNAMVRECWDVAWNPIFDEAISDQRIMELLRMQQFLAHKQPLRGECNGWVWDNAPLSVPKAYARIREGQKVEAPTFILAYRSIWRQKVLLNGGGTVPGCPSPSIQKKKKKVLLKVQIFGCLVMK